jgi:V/A-type H+-transporting ATPase subunit B
VQEVIALAQVIGEDELSDIDKKYLEFGHEFENKFLKQSLDENRDMAETLELAWEVLSILPKQELDRIDPKMIEIYYKG